MEQKHRKSLKFEHPYQIAAKMEDIIDKVGRIKETKLSPCPLTTTMVCWQ